MKKAALITGSAKRIGKAIAIHLAESGFDIALHYNTSKADAKKVLKEIKDKGQNCVLFQFDLTNTKDILFLINKVKQSFPSLSLLINNASIFAESSFLKSDIAFFENHFNINFKAPFFLSQSFAKSIKKGHIINLLDTNITRDRTKYFIYNLTKKMLSEFTKMAAAELAPDIRVNAIAPGRIIPPLNKEKEYLKHSLDSVPLEKWGSIQNILQSIDFLCENDYLTGQCIFAGGGDHLR
ncbi:MAG: hypothetical protein A3I68_08025 [Candidatus Melainabacteria bacterium RIFCSPLOWO2_02_FULL_35_15]|nr:MAG: hypothetical protein A3F80_02505 [Candidatus Melainabacteria bacterium RIFCSPLOWO2_12_FULL_35_11]OGI14235.1 MAG: hypothetical protein A3I68_08025 [Candidatus Melainabacteria bacterium RIFCSPLOWO2_02_FULL_35_15]